VHFHGWVFNLSIVIPQLIVSLVAGLIIMNSQNKNIVFLISRVSLAISAFAWMMVNESKKK